MKGSSNDIAQLPENVNFLKKGVPEIFFSSLKMKQLSETHLSNVLMTLSDLRNLSCSGGAIADYYEADIVMSCDYSSFGAALENRSWNPGAYGYGFNGMEKDNEVKGEGNSYDFGARIYDPRLGRWLGLDQVVKPNVSPFIVFKNNPIAFVDPNGEDDVFHVTYIKKDGTKVELVLYSYKESYITAVKSADVILGMRDVNAVITNVNNIPEGYQASANPTRWDRHMYLIVDEQQGIVSLSKVEYKERLTLVEKFIGITAKIVSQGIKVWGPGSGAEDRGRKRKALRNGDIFEVDLSSTDWELFELAVVAGTYKYGPENVPGGQYRQPDQTNNSKNNTNLPNDSAPTDYSQALTLDVSYSLIGSNGRVVGEVRSETISGEQYETYKDKKDFKVNNAEFPKKEN